MGKSRHSIESGGGGGRPIKKNSRDKRAGLMDGMRGGSPTKDEIARVIVSVPEIISMSKPETIEPAPVVIPEHNVEVKPPQTASEPEVATVPPPPVVEQPAAVAAPEAAEVSTDPNKLSGRVQDAYLTYIKTLRDGGVNPENMAPDAWDTMYKAIQTAKNLSVDYRNSHSDTERKEIAERLQHLAESVERGKIAETLQKAALRSVEKTRKQQDDVKSKKEAGASKKLSSRETLSVISEALDHLPASTDIPVVSPALPDETAVASPEPEVTAPMKSAPTSLEDIYGDREVPKSVAEMFAKLKGKVKREDYLKKVAADEDEKAAKRQKRESRRKPKSPKVEKPPETNNPWETYGGRLSEMENLLKARYPEWKDVPSELLEKYYSLTREQLGNIEAKDEAMQKATAADVEDFINELQTPSMPVVPPPPEVVQSPAPAAETGPQVPQAHKNEVDASEFAAPQYASRDMQAEVDALNESKPEPEPALPTVEEHEPNVFRKNRERLIPTLTDVVELPGQQIGREAENQLPEARPFGVGTEIRDDGMEYVSIMPSSIGGEGTPKEWRDRLREAVGKFVGGAKEKVEWWKSAEEGLVRRSDELNTVAEKISGGEKLFRKLGEQYNKLHWGYKLAVGAGLGVGYGAALSAVSIPAIVGCILGIGAQRTLGLATMYLKYEKTRPYGDRNQGEFWNWSGPREKAMMKSMLYTAAMTAGMAYMAKEISDHDLVNRTKEWLGNMMDKFVGNHPEAGAIATASSVLPEKVQIKSDGAPLEQHIPVPQSTPSPEVQQPVAAAAVSEQVQRPIAQGIQRPEAPPSFEMPKHADFSIHEDDTTISPYDVTPTDQTGAEDVLSTETDEVEEPEASTELAAPTPEASVEQTAPAPEAPSAVEPPPTESVAPSPTVETGPNVFVNDHGISVDPDVTQAYLSADRVYLFGGDVTDAQAQEYAMKNRVSVFVDKSYKIFGLYDVHRVVEFVPAESGPPVMVIHNGPSLIPDPKTFTKRF